MSGILNPDDTLACAQSTVVDIALKLLGHDAIYVSYDVHLHQRRAKNTTQKRLFAVKHWLHNHLLQVCISTIEQEVLKGCKSSEGLKCC